MQVHFLQIFLDDLPAIIQDHNLALLSSWGLTKITPVKPIIWAWKVRSPQPWSSRAPCQTHLCLLPHLSLSSGRTRTFQVPSSSQQHAATRFLTPNHVPDEVVFQIRFHALWLLENYNAQWLQSFPLYYSCVPVTKDNSREQSQQLSHGWALSPVYTSLFSKVTRWKSSSKKEPKLY